MRIALVTTSFLPRIGGAEFVVHHLARHWSLQGHEVCVFNTTSDVPTHADGAYTVRRFDELPGAYRFGQHRFPYRKYGAAIMSRILREYRPDLLSAHFGYPVALWLSEVRPVPRFLITCHGPALNEASTGPRRRFGIDREIANALNSSIGAVALSSHVRKVMTEIGVEPSNIVDIPNGVDVDRFRRPVLFDLRKRFGIPRESLVLLSVGRESWAKGYEAGIRAFTEACRADPTAYYLIVGRGVGVWDQLRKRLPGGDRIVLCEGLHGDDLVGAYQEADLFFLPSVKETFPLVVVEAMAAGLPAIVTDVSGSQDAIANMDNGFVVPPGDVEAMTMAIRTLVGDGNLRDRFGAANHKRAETYDWTRISRMYLEAAERRSGRP